MLAPLSPDDAAMMDRLTKQRLLLPDLTLAGRAGLEIGPRGGPLVLKSESDVRYVDYAGTEEIRATQPDAALRPEDIVEVDIIWGETPLRDALAAPADYIVASHVVEHVPDLIGWLKELRDAIRPGGLLGLAVPDRRFTFDLMRPESTLAELVEAYLLRRLRPAVRQIFEAGSRSVEITPEAAWRGEAPAAALRGLLPGRLPGLLPWAQLLLETGQYVDTHCWVFTPHSFLDRLEELAWLGLLPWEVASFRPTAGDDWEFLVTLRAGDAAPEPVLRSIAAARETLGGAETEARYRAAVKEPALRAAEARIAVLEHELARHRGSTSWRVTAPLRALARRLLRR